MILIPAIDIKGGRCVRLTQGAMDSETVYSEDPAEMARQWEAQGAERLHLVDLDGAVGGTTVHYELIAQMIKAVQIPVQVGGGIRDLERVERYLSVGAAAVILGTAALQNEALVKEATRKFPRQIIAGIDSKQGQVAVRGWTEIHPEEVATLAYRMQEAGVAALILTDIEKDGMLAGPNIDLFREIGMQVEIPIIASGGVTTLKQIQQLAEIPGVEGAIVGKALYTGALSLPKALAMLRGEG
ncbi:MAG: 1-(5-phosphoribosyl)-5-[(5-phosphoribosylamino)methylideneamino]imidazole-4-carboxamide isomerase [Nitrospirae bacterium]|nr:1-(5-phosphoribosyl)-5-[(5-phosphoribosylamino)methylideneamino]imidazole-4-carboxamide isomerase [Candidatus Manganitrophaceae bacterium]